MAWDKGFNFRQSSGFVTDGSDETYVLAGETYPTTRNGVTFGWTYGPFSDRDRNAGNDRRLAGINFMVSGDVALFRVDLPGATDYQIRLAIGDNDFSVPDAGVTILDTSSAVVTVPKQAVGAAQWVDATNVLRTSNADWVANNAFAVATFATTVLVMRLENASSGNSVISHLFVSQVTDKSKHAGFLRKVSRPRPFAPGIAR